MKQSKKLLRGFLIALFWIIAWEVLALLIGKEIILPSPVATFSALIRIAQTHSFYKAVFYSLIRIIVGYTSGIVIGILGAVLTYKFSLLRALLTPILKIIKAVPVASFIILAFFWFKSDILPAFIAFLMVLPMIWSITEAELFAVDKKYIEQARVFGLSKFKIFTQITLPFIMPALASTALTALGFAWKSGVAAEIICLPKQSFGNLLHVSKLHIEIAEVFAITAVVALLSMLLEFLIKKVIRRYSNDKIR